MGQSELGAVALTKAIWWDLRLASLLTHLLLSFVEVMVTVSICCAILSLFISVPPSQE